MKIATSDISVNNVNIRIHRDGFLNDEGVASVVQSRGTSRLDSLGVDLWMMGQGFLIEDDTSRRQDKKDLARAAGIYNYAQAVAHRLMTARGTHPEDAFFGVPWLDYLGRTYVNSQSVISNLIQDITEELYKDSRTSEVVSVTAEFENPTTIVVQCVVLPINVNNEFIEVGLTIRNNNV